MKLEETLWAEYQHEMQCEYGFGAPSMWGNGPRNFQAFLVHRGVIRCPDHPAADILHSWDQTYVILNGLPAGQGIASNHVYECSVCHKQLTAETGVA